MKTWPQSCWKLSKEKAESYQRIKNGFSQSQNYVKENGSLLIIDEIQTGMGRTGTFYAFEAYQIEPDIITIAKALANGIPVGAMLGKIELAEAFGPGSHGTTFGREQSGDGGWPIL